MNGNQINDLLEEENPANMDSRELERKASKVKDSMRDKGFPENYDSLVVSFDWNSPVASTADSRDIHDNVEEVFSELELGENFVITSGHPIRNLRDFREMIGQEDMRLVGESGAMYLNGTKEAEELRPEESKEELYELHREVYEKAAEEERKILVQPDKSSVKGCIRAEGEGRPGDRRGGTYDLGETNLDTEQIYNKLVEVGDPNEFEYEDEGYVRFDNSLENAAFLTEVFRNSFYYPGVRFQKDGENLILYTDQDDPEISRDEALDFLVDSLPDGWDYSRNDDWGVDFKREDTDFSKQDGLEAAYSDHQNPFFTHVGDKESDVLELENGVHFPIEDSQAHRKAKEYAVPVKDAEEYITVLNKAVGDLNY